MENAILHVGHVEDDVVMFQMFLISPWWFLHIKSFHSEILTSPKSQNWRQRLLEVDFLSLCQRSLNFRDVPSFLLHSNFLKVRWGPHARFQHHLLIFPRPGSPVPTSHRFISRVIWNSGKWWWETPCAKVLFKCVCVFFCFRSCFNQQPFLLTLFMIKEVGYPSRYFKTSTQTFQQKPGSTPWN